MRVRCAAWAIVLLAACCEPNTPRAPERPSSVPASAFWCGGSDGGVFVQLTRNTEKKNSYFGTIYTENDGDIWYRGEFRMDPKNPGTPPKAGANWCNAWDGTRLYLQGGGALIALGVENDHLE